MPKVWTSLPLAAAIMTLAFVPSRADLYCNGSDPELMADCLTGTGDVLHYDDFEDGEADCHFGAKGLDSADGWGGSGYAPGCPSTGCTSGQPYTDIGEMSCFGRPGGAAGTKFTAYSGKRPADRQGQTPWMPDHNWNQDVSEAYARWFVKYTPFHQMGGNDKLMATLNPRQGSGAAQGIFYGNMAGQGQDAYGGCSPYYFSVAGDGNKGQNQGNIMPLCPSDHWYFVEHHWKLDSNGADGVWEMWINDCGPSGLLADCGPSPILRARYTNINYKDGAKMANLWFQNYLSGIDARPGESYLDEVLVMKTGPIGFRGLSAPAVGGGLAPARPKGLRLP